MPAEGPTVTLGPGAREGVSAVGSVPVIAVECVE